jgi:hypothetical protein
MRNIVQIILVLAIFATGAAIVVHAVVKVRAAADRIQCANNLLTLQGTLSAYHDVNKQYPPGTVPNKHLPPQDRLSWLVLCHS